MPILKVQKIENCCCHDFSAAILLVTYEGLEGNERSAKSPLNDVESGQKILRQKNGGENAFSCEKEGEGNFPEVASEKRKGRRDNR